jgi:hypothetical protein
MPDVQVSRPPPNPFYRWEYQCSLSHGSAWLSISAPGAAIASQDAQDVIDWMKLIIKQLERHATLPVPEQAKVEE